MKQLKKKLVLSRETVSDLNHRDMKKVKGGADTLYETCIETLDCPTWFCPTGGIKTCMLP